MTPPATETDAQALHDRLNPIEAQRTVVAALKMCRTSMLRQAIVAEMIGLGLEPSEPIVFRLADAMAGYTILRVKSGRLYVADVTDRSIAEVARLWIESDPEIREKQIGDQHA